MADPFSIALGQQRAKRVSSSQSRKLWNKCHLNLPLIPFYSQGRVPCRRHLQDEVLAARPWSQGSSRSNPRVPRPLGTSTPRSSPTARPLLFPKDLGSFTLKYFPGSCWSILGVWTGHTREGSVLLCGLLPSPVGWHGKRKTSVLFCKYKTKMHFYIKFELAF